MELNVFLENATAAHVVSGKSLLSQLIEIIKLRLSHSKLGADDYYLYELFDDQRFTLEAKHQFLGWRRSAKIDRLLNSDESRVYANDKLKFSEAMSSSGFKTPKILAVFREHGRSFVGAHHLSSDADIKNFFTRRSTYPVFCKPVHGTYGRGAFSVLSCDSDDQSLQVGDGTVRSISEIALQFQQKSAYGYIVQELLVPHPDVEAIVGARLSSLRIVVLQTERGPHIHRAVWKLPVGRNMSDNFMHGKLGNLIACINPSDGRVTNVMGMENSSLVSISKHPDTAADLNQLSVPLWPEMVDFCGRASLLFPGLAMQHWDIAICPEGPVAIEVNVDGSVDLHQLAGRKGFLDESLESLLMPHGSK